MNARTVVAMLALVASLGLVAGCSKSAPAPDPATPPAAGAPQSGSPHAGAPRPGVAWPAGLPVAGQVRCPAPTLQVATAPQLSAALASAAPGTVIGLADGVYDGQFTSSARGTAAAPTWLCGSPRAVLTGPGTASGIVLHLQRGAQWRLVGFAVTNGQKGVMLDGTTGSVVQGLTVSHIGDEGIHLRTASTGNVVRDNTIFDTGLRRVKFGEGVYVGSAVSNWGEISDGQPDRSDHNVVVANTIHDTAAENVDIKEGTTGGVVADNSFDGAGMRGDADSWVDVKGNGWLIQANHGARARTNGFETNVQADGWGEHNTFDANSGDVGGSGYGFALDPPETNRVTCSNAVNNAKQGASNAPCS